MSTLFVVPCGRAKLGHTAEARDLYSSPHFAFALRQVEAAASAVPGSVVRILSARYGLVHPSWRLDPYDMSVGHPDSISPPELAGQLWALHSRDGSLAVRAFLPRAYLERLREGIQAAQILRGFVVTLTDEYAAAPGIGYQRRVLAELGKSG